MVDILKQFSTSSRTIADFFDQSGLAFYIPLYQREYSWNEEAANKDWNAKWIYYSYLAEKDPARLGSLALQAKCKSVTLDEKTIELLKNAHYNEHVLPLVSLGIDGVWDVELVKKRSVRLCEILGERMFNWL